MGRGVRIDDRNSGSSSFRDFGTGEVGGGGRGWGTGFLRVKLNDPREEIS